jgi:ABC-type multidrug transport system fused ATPase/permease subunit
MYRLISRHFTNLDNLFELLHHEVPVSDAENAHVLKTGAGEIVFDNVCFSYNSRVKKKKKRRDADESVGLLSDTKYTSLNRTNFCFCLFVCLFVCFCCCVVLRLIARAIQEYVLKNVSFVLRPSTFVAIVGNSGSGTLIILYS